MTRIYEKVKQDKHFFRLLFLLSALFCFSINKDLTAQTDYEFWFAAPEISFETVDPSPIILQNLDRPIKLYFTTAEGPATVEINQPANPSFVTITVTVQNDSAEIVDLTSYIDLIENKPANTILNYGLKITSDKPISVYYEIQSLENQATYSLLGRNALGREFIIPSQNHFSNYEYCDPPARNQFSIIATEDSTGILIVPSSEILGYAATDTVNIVLQKGQTWTAKAISNDSVENLGGSVVMANKPIAVTLTEDLIFISNPSLSDTSFDVAGDQLIPRRICNTEYIVCGANLPPIGNRIIVYAFEDSTLVSFNGTLHDSINRREYSEINIQFPDKIGYISADKPILVYHFWGCSDQYVANPASEIVPPLICSGSKKVTLTNTSPNSMLGVGPTLFIVTKTLFKDDFTITGLPPVSIPNFWDTVPGTNEEWVYQSLGFGNNAWPPSLTRVLSNSKGRFQISMRLNHPWYFSKSSFHSDFSGLSLGPDKHICPGDSILLDAGYGRNSYFWNTGDTTQTIWIFNPGTFWVNTTEPDCNLSDTIIISYYPFIPINLGPDRIICIGDSIHLDAGTGRDWYLWNTGDTTQTIWIQNSGSYWVRVPDEYCTLSDTIEISHTLTPVITNVPLSKSICSGESTIILLTSSLPNTEFSWTAKCSSPLVSGYGPGTGDTIEQVLTNTTPASETVTYTITPSLGDCQGDSVEYLVTVTPGDSVLVSISASDDSICNGTSVTYTATPVHGGTNPSYQWMVNGINQGVFNVVFSYSPSDSDTVYCVLTSSDTVCISNNPATSNEFIMTVFPNLPVSISISTTNNPVCEGSTATYTASTGNKGTLPVFQWFVNGNPVGTDDSTFAYTPSNGDQVFCVLTSGEQCISNNPATSDTITMIVNPLLPVGLFISASPNPVCEGLPVSFTTTPVNGGTMPSYQWQVNGINSGTNNPDFTYTPVDGDFVTCFLTSNAECVTNNPASSNAINMSVGEAPDVSFAVCFDTITTLNSKPFKLKGGIPLGGTYSGPGVDQITGYFNPPMAGVGLKTISYSYTNQYTCSNNATRSISVVNPAPFSCGDSLTDIRDNRKYPSIQIGSQCWLAVNLNHGQQIGGSLAQRDNCLVEKYCYNDIQANCTQYGAFYQWDELMRYEDVEEFQGLCPPGWHVPSEADWNILFSSWINNAFAGKPLLFTGYSGFNVMLAGVEFFNQVNRFADFASIMWSSTSHGPYKAWSHGLNKFNYSVSYYPSYRSNAFSVRCVLD